MTGLLKNGDFVRYSGQNHYLTNGKEYQVFDVKQTSGKPAFHLIDDTGDTIFALFPQCAHGKWEIVGKEEEEEDPKTPAQRLGYNVGDTFRVIKGFQYEVGSIVTLYFDDGTSAPLFAGEGTRYNNADGKPGAFVGLDSLEKIVPGAAKEAHKGHLLCIEPCLGFTKGNKYLIKAVAGEVDLAVGGIVGNDGYNVIDDDGDLRYVAVIEGRENNFEKVVDWQISGGVVLPHREETTTTTTTTTKESTVSEFKINDKVRVKSEISEPADCWGQVRPGDIGVIKEIYSTRLLIDFPRQRGWKAKPSEMELVKEEEELKPTQENQNMTTTTSTARQPELKSFCVDLSEVSADQANELLSLAVALGAHRVEGVSDGEMDEDEAVAKYPNLGGASFFNRNSYGYAGVDNDNDTYLLDDTGPYEDNLMTYEGAKLMLTGTPKVEEKLSGVQKPEMKAFYLPFSAVDGDATRVMEIFKRLQAVGVELHDLAHNRGEDEKVRHDQANEGFTGACCYIGAFKIFGVTQKGDKFLTYVNDYASEFSTGAVEMTLAELEEFLSKIEKPVKASNKPKLRQRKLKVTYTNGKPYLLKNVVSVDIKPEEGTVNVTYNQKKGKVVMHNNVVIPFSELKSVKFEGPGSVGAEYIFKNGKVVQVIQDFSHADFQHKSH